MRFVHLLARATSTPWFITEPALAAIRDVLQARINGLPTNLADVAPEAPPSEDEDPAAATAPSIAVIPVRGVLAKSVNPIEALCGACDYDAILSDYAAALADPAISAVVLKFDSPGGAAMGCPETFTALRDLRASTDKPLLAFTDGTLASAAYYLAAACDIISCTPSAYVGSTGTKLTLVDESEKHAKEGRRYLTIKSGTMKDIGNPTRAATAEEIGVLQGEVDYLFGLFKRDVQSTRPQVADAAFETALPYYGPFALEHGIVDEVVSGWPAYLANLAATLAPETASI